MLNTTNFTGLIQSQAETYGDKAVMSYRDYASGVWKDVTWRQFAHTVERVSRALVAMGVKEQENIAVFSQNKPEIMTTDFGAYGVRVVSVPFYATSSEHQVKYMVQDAEIRVLFVGEQYQYDVAIKALKLCPTLETIVRFDPDIQTDAMDRVSISYEEFLAKGDDLALEEEVKARKNRANVDDLLNILYTSGTTGASKGVMITMRMYRAALASNDAAMNLTENDVVMNFLPFTHIFERAWSYWSLARGCRLAINLRPQDILQSLQEVHPTCMCAVPRFWEKVYAGVKEKIAASSTMQRNIMNEALTVCRDYNVRYKLKGLPAPLPIKLRYIFFEKTCIALLKKTLGLERGNFFPTAGAAIPKEVEEFVNSAGINIITGYGMTETTATVTCQWKKHKSIGSVGFLIDGIEIKIDHDNNDEILLKGDTITKGYYHRAEATAQTIDADGWLHTGDSGEFRGDELFLKDRIKDLFKTSNGKYIAPQMLEAVLVVDRYIDQLVIIADMRKYVSALIIPEYNLLGEWAKNEGISFSTNEELCANPKVVQMVMERITTMQQGFATYEQIKRITLLPKPFSIEEGTLTNTLKVKRPAVNEMYKSIIDKMYED